MAGALQGLQNQCAFLMVVSAVYSDFVMIVQVVQYFFWQQSHVVISLCSGEALHFEQGVSPSFLPLTIFNYYPYFLIISWDILLIKCSKCWSLQRLASIVQFLSDFQISLLSLTCEKKRKRKSLIYPWVCRLFSSIGYQNILLFLFYPMLYKCPDFESYIHRKF